MPSHKKVHLDSRAKDSKLFFMLILCLISHLLRKLLKMREIIIDMFNTSAFIGEVRKYFQLMNYRFASGNRIHWHSYTSWIALLINGLRSVTQEAFKAYSTAVWGQAEAQLKHSPLVARIQLSFITSIEAAMRQETFQSIGYTFLNFVANTFFLSSKDALTKFLLIFLYLFIYTNFGKVFFLNIFMSWEFQQRISIFWIF